ncbi:hypothetical protein [Gordonia soli]|uniref:hypothetical protein n=1 Tax=Gordonia soli TaxID=320799 RepID=UPI001FE13148|nr:hypothetical protein [Gordonia soli]
MTAEQKTSVDAAQNTADEPMSPVGHRAAGRRRHLVVKLTAVLTLGTIVAATIGATGSAEVLGPIRPAAATPVAESTNKSTKDEKAESVDERIERIAAERPMLKAPKANEGRDTTCVSGEFATLSVVYDSIFESVLPSLPPQLRPTAQSARIAAHRDMKRLHVSSLAVSNHPMTRGADKDDPAVLYRDSVSQWIVSQLLNIRDGRQHDAIPVGNLTVSQAVETVWLYLSVTVFAPITLASGLIPPLGSPLTGTALEALSGYVTYGSILSLVVAGGTLGLQFLYAGISAALIDQCLVQVTDEQRRSAGRPSDTVRYDIPIPAIVAETANQLALADSDTCAPIGSFSLERVLQRTSDQAIRTTSNPAAKQRIKAQTRTLMHQLRTTRVPHNLIPADPYDYTQAELAASIVGRVIPIVGGAPLGIALGLSHNKNEGADFGEMIPLADLTVTKSLTAAYYTYSFAQFLFGTVGGLLEPSLLAPLGLSSLPVTPVRLASALLSLPLTYGLIVYQNVVRSMCLREDDTSGTGLGAQKDSRDGQSVQRAGGSAAGRTSAAKPSRAVTPSSPAKPSRAATPSSAVKPNRAATSGRASTAPHRTSAAPVRIAGDGR